MCLNVISLDTDPLYFNIFSTSQFDEIYLSDQKSWLGLISDRAAILLIVVCYFLKNIDISWFFGFVCNTPFHWYVEFFFEFFSRAIQVLPVNIDPIPKDIIQDFGLLDLYDVSFFTSNYIANSYLFFINDIRVIPCLIQ